MSRGLRVRDASPTDREAVFEFCRNTWPGYGDYIPRVWQRWIRDHSGRFLVAELGGTPVGIAKITDFGEGEVWLEGLRVDRRYRGRGIGDHINAEVMRTLSRSKPRRVRFSTGTTNRASRRISEKCGFEVVARLRYYWRRSRKGEVRGDVASRRDIGAIHDYISQSRFLQLSSGLISEGWVFREFTRHLLGTYVRRRRVIVMSKAGEITGVAIYPYEENDESTTLGFVDGDDTIVKTFARNCMYLSKAQGLEYCSVAVPTRRFARLVEEAGFSRKDSVGQIVLEYGETSFRLPRTERS